MKHSGVAYNTSGFSCRWDSGHIGFIYVAKNQLREDYGWTRITSKRRKKVEGWLAGEIKVFSQWANGNVYGFQLYYHDVEEPYNLRRGARLMQRVLSRLGTNHSGRTRGVRYC